MPPTRQQLLRAAEHFCQAFAAKKPVDELLKYFSTKRTSAFEHGLQLMAPFTGREYEGVDGIQRYFETISGLLVYENMKFLHYIADAEEMKVSAIGNALFTWLNNGQSWPETFIYALEFDEDLKVVRYEVWADTGAAHLASKGELRT